MTDPRHEYGRCGEELAEQHLKQRGFKPVARRFNTPVGELDLVMTDGPTVVFVEVKTRRDCRFADATDSINATKKRRLTRAAFWFLHQQRWEKRPCRFDVITIVGQDPPALEHIVDFFIPNEQS